MSKNITLDLTPLEAEELHGLLVMITTNGDQWEMLDCRALARLDSKLAFTMRGERG